MGGHGNGAEHAEEASPRSEWHCQQPPASYKAKPLHLGGSSPEEPITGKHALVAGMYEADVKIQGSSSSWGWNLSTDEVPIGQMG